MTLENRMYSPLEVLDIAEQYAESKSKRLITETVRTTLRAIGVLKPTMNRSEANAKPVPAERWPTPFVMESLRCVKKGRNVIINRDDFESWLKENEFN